MKGEELSANIIITDLLHVSCYKTVQSPKAILSFNISDLQFFPHRLPKLAGDYFFSSKMVPMLLLMYHKFIECSA